MSNLQVFEHKEFGKIRSLTVNGEPWFIGKEIAERLGYKLARKAIADHVDAEDVLKQNALTNGGEQQILTINESGLYSLILASKLPAAKRFKRWVTSEVLPAIRNTGNYGINRRRLTASEYLKAAELVASCEPDRLPHVLNFLKNAGMQIQETVTPEPPPKQLQPTGDALARQWNICRRRMQGKSVRQLSQLLNIPIATAYNYKKGKHRPHPERQKRIAEIFEIRQNLT